MGSRLRTMAGGENNTSKGAGRFVQFYQQHGSTEVLLSPPMYGMVTVLTTEGRVQNGLTSPKDVGQSRLYSGPPDTTRKLWQGGRGH